MNTPTFQNSVSHYSSSSPVVRTGPENTGDSDSSPAIESHATIDPEALIRELSKLALGHEDHTGNYRWIQYVHNGPDDDGFNRDVCLKDDDSDDGHEYDYDTESLDFKWHLNTFCLKKAVLEPYDIQQAEASRVTTTSNLYCLTFISISRILRLP